MSKLSHLKQIRSWDQYQAKPVELPKTVKETAYKTLVRPKLQYVCSAWDRHHQKDKAALERIQRKAARFVTGSYDRTTSVTEMLQDLQWDTLEMMRRHARLSTIYKICHGLLDGD